MIRRLVDNNGRNLPRVYLGARIVPLRADEDLDWSYLRAPQRQGYGLVVEMVEVLFPDADREMLPWKTPQRCAALQRGTGAIPPLRANTR